MCSLQYGCCSKSRRPILDVMLLPSPFGPRFCAPCPPLAEASDLYVAGRSYVDSSVSELVKVGVESRPNFVHFWTCSTGSARLLSAASLLAAACLGSSPRSFTHIDHPAQSLRARRRKSRHHRSQSSFPIIVRHRVCASFAFRQNGLHPSIQQKNSERSPHSTWASSGPDRRRPWIKLQRLLGLSPSNLARVHVIVEWALYSASHISFNDEQPQSGAPQIASVRLSSKCLCNHCCPLFQVLLFLLQKGSYFCTSRGRRARMAVRTACDCGIFASGP